MEINVISVDIGVKNLAFCVAKLKNFQLSASNFIVEKLQCFNLYECDRCHHAKLEARQINKYFQLQETKIVAVPVELRALCKDCDAQLVEESSDVTDKNLEYKILTKNFFGRQDIRDFLLQAPPPLLNLVLIEQQPRLNLAMKSMQDNVANFFLSVANTSLVYVSPKHKSKKKEYSERKKESVQSCLANPFLTETQKNFVRTHKKKDDLCDAFLNMYHYVDNNLKLQ